jgi:SAM-dependent methyltransferase
VEGLAYEQFRDLEKSHWWFLGRNAIFSSLLRERVVPSLRREPGSVRTLDLGCGMGGHFDFLKEHGPVVGVDLERSGLRHCVERGYRSVAVGDATNLPFDDETFDVVAAFDTIEHVPDDEAAFRESFRTLRKGGRFFLSGPAWQFLYSHQDRVVHHARRYTTGVLRRRVEAAGFEVERASYINFFLFPLILPAVLLIKLNEKIRPPSADDATTNASYAFPKWANAVCRAIFSFESRVLKRVSVPFGHSLILIARKPGA